MSVLLAPPSPEESGSRERLDSDTPQLGGLGAADGLGAGGHEVQGLSKERSSAVSPESSSIIKATRTERYLHLQLQLVHLERVVALLATSDETQVEGRQVLGEINAFPDAQAERDAFHIRRAELQAKLNTQEELWRQSAAELINHARSKRGIWAWISQWFLLIAYKYQYWRMIRTFSNLSNLLDARMRRQTETSARQDAVIQKAGKVFEEMGAVEGELSEEVLQLVILSKAP